MKNTRLTKISLRKLKLWTAISEETLRSLLKKESKNELLSYEAIKLKIYLFTFIILFI